MGGQVSMPWVADPQNRSGEGRPGRMVNAGSHAALENRIRGLEVHNHGRSGSCSYVLAALCRE